MVAAFADLRADFLEGNVAVVLEKDLPPRLCMEIDGIKEGAVDVENGCLVFHGKVAVGGLRAVFNKKGRAGHNAVTRVWSDVGNPDIPPMNPEPSKNQDPDLVKVTLPAKRPYIARVFEGCVVLVVLLVLASVCLPVFNSVAVRGPQTKALAQAKQIGLALKIFAGDNDGRYPTEGVPAEMTQPPANANVAFACLFPTYTTSEKIFGNKLSAYQTRIPDDVIDNPPTFPPRKTLEPGENVYGYVMGLTDKSPGDSPLVVDGTDGTGHYRTDPKSFGGVWQGKQAIIIRLDNSGSLGDLHGPAEARYVAQSPEHPERNLLAPSSLGAGVRLLDPAIAGH